MTRNRTLVTMAYHNIYNIYNTREVVDLDGPSQTHLISGDHTIMVNYGLSLPSSRPPRQQTLTGPTTHCPWLHTGVSNPGHNGRPRYWAHARNNGPGRWYGSHPGRPRFTGLPGPDALYHQPCMAPGSAPGYRTPVGHNMGSMPATWSDQADHIQSLSTTPFPPSPPS